MQDTHGVGLCDLVGGWWVVLFLVGFYCSLFWGFSSFSCGSGCVGSIGF
jgi:hypothetical protein